ncbi:hypothetical protein Patl1_18818 [Pistacia atlantica]|uniref:Uncharacterized protein n=1 Tax=Pistacia atlantica TaxID=434234 RepID=A0ACC1C2L9_9ROSI|nr:hypothetical protein Patl1_18818 [Pistacia atlantica]
MGDESSKYVMDLELAIQRELAYRRKIFLSQLQTDKDFKTDPVPLERIAHVPSSSPSVSPSRTPTSKSLSSSSPWLSGMKRDAAPSGSESLQPQQPQSSNSKPMRTNQSDVIFCTICNVPCHAKKLTSRGGARCVIPVAQVQNCSNSTYVVKSTRLN